MKDVAFITLTNSGYINYTLNCLESLKRIGLSSSLHTYVIGKEGYDLLKGKGYKCTLLKDDKSMTKMQTYNISNKGNWSDINFKKFDIIQENLKKYKYVCFTDGDIVFENKKFLQYLRDNIESYDVLIQNDTLNDKVNENYHNNNICAGFMYIKSNKNTLSLLNPEIAKKYKSLNPEIAKKYKTKNAWTDQTYLNEIKTKMKYKLLPLGLFPNGQYYYKNNSNMSPYMIHFNWLVGHKKREKMKYYNKWYLDSKQNKTKNNKTKNNKTKKNKK